LFTIELNTHKLQITTDQISRYLFHKPLSNILTWIAGHNLYSKGFKVHHKLTLHHIFQGNYLLTKFTQILSSSA